MNGDGVITNEDNTEEVVDGIKEALAAALESIGLAAEGYAKIACPVDTGRLRNSITHEVDGEDVYIGSNVEYAPDVELGTYKSNAKPFLRPAAEDHGQEYRDIIEKYLEGQ